MRKFLIGIVAIILLATVCGYALWAGQRPVGHYLSDLRIQLALEQGVPGERGNLLGIEPELFLGDYQNVARLHRKLAAYLEQARAKGFLSSKTIVVLPEHIGTWLWTTGEKEEFYQAIHREEAQNWLALSNPLQFAAAWVRAEGRDRTADARLRMKARRMAEDYQNLFGGLAREFGVTLVAGSIVLPEPRVQDGQLKTGSGALYNSSVVFGHDGRAIGQPQRQLYPDRKARRYLNAAEPLLQVVDTPAGRLGILIGSDSWYPDNYRQLDAQAARLIAVPAYLEGQDRWSQPWTGYPSLWAPPQPSLQAGEVSEAQAWQKLTLAGSAFSPNALVSLSVFMNGRFWDRPSAGQSFSGRFGEANSGISLHGARLLNVWL
ncbi:nitrilase-related carbon-nitrogen hydrolase [Pseudomonas sp. R5(2019)]|uniref:nitrilase-related carbon-nitrogen hydrolase n=1 Tax=Pseudomonas sp. R5(2019) TaxID=2697566 RepID=UPI0014134D0F|nr:nitrilase-related carbon-nitrogen hydrolase [Pseudomonas sp. R5(2019)]NBA94282.1 carbon-nitrogen hydrolase family protein [Pseudomonas sp. R5(2019)]